MALFLLRSSSANKTYPAGMSSPTHAFLREMGKTNIVAYRLRSESLATGVPR